MDRADEPHTIGAPALSETVARGLPNLVDGGKPRRYRFVSRFGAERDCASSARRGQAIVEGATDAIVVVDHDGRIVMLNRAGERLFAYCENELVGQEALVLVPARLRQSLRAELERHPEDVVGRCSRLPALRSDGVEFLAEIAVSRVECPGELLFAGHVRDIGGREGSNATDRFLSDATKALGASLDPPSSLTAVARLAIPNFADAYCVLTIDDEDVMRPIAWAHQTAEKQRPLDTLFSSPHRPTMLERVAEEAIRTGHTIVIGDATEDGRTRSPSHADEARLLHALRPASLLVVPIVLCGRKLGAFVFCYCESGRRYEEADAGVFEELAYRAAAALENARAYEDAKRAIAHRDDVLGIVAHDLKTPLATVLLAAQLLQRMTRYDDVDAVRKHVGIIFRSASRMRILIADLVDLASIQAGHLKLERSPNDVRAFVEDVAESLRPLARNKGIELTTRIAAGIGEVSCDRDRVQQLLSNLVDNAVKATSSGGTIVLSVERDAHDVVFSVRDSGTGIAKDELPRVFERYWRSADAGYTGTGRGLAIAKAVVEGHGGRIWAESEPGVGSTFTFALPLEPSCSVAPVMQRMEES